MMVYLVYLKLRNDEILHLQLEHVQELDYELLLGFVELVLELVMLEQILELVEVLLILEPVAMLR